MNGTIQPFLSIELVCIVVLLACYWKAGDPKNDVASSALIISMVATMIAIGLLPAGVTASLDSYISDQQSSLPSFYDYVGADGLKLLNQHMSRATLIHTPLVILCMALLCLTVWRFVRRSSS